MLNINIRNQAYDTNLITAILLCYKIKGTQF